MSRPIVECNIRGPGRSYAAGDPRATRLGESLGDGTGQAICDEASRDFPSISKVLERAGLVSPAGRPTAALSHRNQALAEADECWRTIARSGRPTSNVSDDLLDELKTQQRNAEPPNAKETTDERTLESYDPTTVRS